MKRFFIGIWEFLVMPFEAVAVLIDDSRRYNEDGSWDKYNRRRNERERKKQDRKDKKEAKYGKH